MSKYTDTFNQMLVDLKDTGLYKAIKSFVNRIAGTGLTNAQIQQNEFNALEAEKDRSFQAEQTNIAYERSLKAHQTAVQDMQNAGLNPALMYGGGAGGTTSVPSAPSGAQASAASDSGNGMSFSDLLRLVTLPKELKNMESMIGLREAQADTQRTQSALNELNIEWFEPMTQAKLDDIKSVIGSRTVQNALAQQGIKESQAREALDLQQAILAAIDAKTRNELNEKHLSLMDADIALREAEKLHRYEEIERIKHEISVLDAQSAELMQRAITEAAQAGALDAQTMNLLEQNDIIRYDKDIKRFEATHQEAYWKWKKAMYVVDGVVKAGNMVSGFYMPRVGSPSGNPAATIYNGMNTPGYQYVPGFD